MAILDMSGRPIANKTQQEDTVQISTGNYRPENMMIVASLVDKESEEPVYSFEIVIPFDRFEFYVEYPEILTLTINNFVGYAYGQQILHVTEDPDSEMLNNWIQEAAEKYSVALSEPLAIDTIFKDNSDIEKYLPYIEDWRKQAEEEKND